MLAEPLLAGGILRRDRHVTERIDQKILLAFLPPTRVAISHQAVCI